MTLSIHMMAGNKLKIYSSVHSRLLYPHHSVDQENWDKAADLRNIYTSGKLNAKEKGNEENKEMKKKKKLVMEEILNHC